jgi:predicted acyl esterase
MGTVGQSQVNETEHSEQEKLLMDVNVTPFEIETKTRHGEMVRADVYLPRNSAGPFPVLLGASPYRKSLRHLPPIPAAFPFIEYGPMQLYLDEGYAYVAMDTPGMGRSERVWDPVSRTESEAIHDMIEHVAGIDWSTTTEAPITHWYGQKAGADTYDHNAAQPSRLRLHERPRTNGASSQQ